MPSRVTQSLIYDFLSLPLAPYQSIYTMVNSKRLARIIQPLSLEFNRIFTILPKIKLLFIIKKAKYATMGFRVQNLLVNHIIVTEQEIADANHLAFFSEMTKTEENSTIQSIIALLEDNNVMKDMKTMKIWISYCLHCLIEFDRGGFDRCPGLHSHHIR